MRSSLVAAGEQAGAFEHDVDVLRFPRQFGRVANGADRNTVTIDGQAFLVTLHGAAERAVYSVETQQVRVHFAVAQIIDGDDLQVLPVALGIQCT